MTSHKVIDKGWKEIAKQLELARKVRSVVGLHNDSVYSDGTSVAQIGAWNEFGTENIPERSFFRSTIAETKSDRREVILRMLRKIYEGKATAMQAIATAGEFMEQKIKAKIVSLSEPANADSTIKIKGSSNPLIDTGQMLQSVQHREDMNG